MKTIPPLFLVDLRELEQWTPHKIIQWAVETFGDGLAMTSSFQQQSLPLLHIVDTTREHILQCGLGIVGLLGTRFTMESDLFTGHASAGGDLEVIIPEPPDREIVHRVIYHELVLGKILNDSRVRLVRIIDSLADGGAEGIILGCTELSLLVKQEDTPVRLFDTTRIHAEAAADYALK